MQVVNINNLEFRWRKDGKKVLDIAHLSVKKAERLFIAGKSGSGKSSLLNLLGGLNSPNNGHIAILGDDLSKKSASQRDQFRADNIGFIFQQFNLVPYLSVMENVLLACQFSVSRRNRIGNRQEDIYAEARRLLDALQVPNELIEHASVMELSVGQQQRVAAARALIGNPPLLIADEPTSALDYDSREAFISLLFEECEKIDTTVIFVSHDTSLASLFNRQINMQEINRA